jgi:hypothetical protein
MVEPFKKMEYVCKKIYRMNKFERGNKRKLKKLSFQKTCHHLIEISMIINKSGLDAAPP